MYLNRQFENINQSPTVALGDQVHELISLGRKIVPLHVGDPDFATPPAIVAMAAEAMRSGQTHYVPSRGIHELRSEIALRLNGVNRISDSSISAYDPETEVLVSHGGVHALFLAMQAILNPGDEVLMPDPNWATHGNIAKQLGAVVTPVPAVAENGFLPTLSAWKEALTNRTRAIIVNYPSNPTGACPPRDYVRQLQHFTREHDLWLISDEVYDNIYFDEVPISAGEFPEDKSHTILVNSFSKTYAMTGWRVGYLAAPMEVIANALKASQNSITCVAPFVQKAAVFALRDPGVQAAVDEMRSAYTRRRDSVMKIYSEYAHSPIHVVPPQGAFYFFLDFRELNMTSEEICKRILDEASVALTPGTAFGRQGEGFARMTIAASDMNVAEGFRAVLNWADTR